MSDHIRRFRQEQQRSEQLLKPFTGVDRHLAEHAGINAILGARGGIIEALRLEEERRDFALGTSGGKSVALNGNKKGFESNRLRMLFRNSVAVE
jgi:hypothetical protein